MTYAFCFFLFFFFNDTATTEIYTLSLHDALPISRHARRLAFVRGPCSGDQKATARGGGRGGGARRSGGARSPSPRRPRRASCRLGSRETARGRSPGDARGSRNERAPRGLHKPLCAR